MVTDINICCGGMSSGLVVLPQYTKYLLIPSGSVSDAVRGFLTIWWTTGLIMVGARNNTATTTQTENIKHFEYCAILSVHCANASTMG